MKAVHSVWFRAWHWLVGRLGSRHWRHWFVGFSILCGVIFFWLAFVPRAATYSLSAVTETASIVVRDAAGIAVHLPRASIWRRGTAFKDEQQMCCSVVLRVTDGVRATLGRKRKGDLLIQLNWDHDRSRAANIVDREGNVTPLENGDVLRVPLDRPAGDGSQNSIPDTVLLSFRGELRVGDDVASFAERTLLLGSIRIVERVPGLDERYLASEATLDPGDAVVWHASNDDRPVIVSGFVHVGSGEGLQVIAHAAADYVLVQRFGAPPYQIKASSWERIGREPLLSGLSAMIICLGALAAFVEVVTKLWGTGAKKNE